jgi:hypothetical protein
MPIVEIDGVGRVELDDSFLRLSAAEQQKTISEIASSAGPKQQAAPTATSAPAPVSNAEADPYAVPDQEVMGPPPEGPFTDYTEDWDAEEAAFQQSQIDKYDDPLPPQDQGSLADWGGNFFRMPNSWDEVGQGLKQGAGAVAEGLAEIPAMIGNPLNASINYFTGSDLSTDLAGTFRDDVLGAPRGDDVSEAVIQGISGGLGFSGAARAGGKIAGNALQKGLYEVGTTPVRDAVAGGTAALSSQGAEDLGFGEFGQAVAGLAGGGLGYAGSGLPKKMGPNARAERFADKQIKENPYAAYEAEVADDVYGIRELRKFGPRSKKFKNTIDTKAINNLDNRYVGRFAERVNQLDIPRSRKITLKETLQARHSIEPAKIDALRDGTPEGDFLADAIHKSQALRRLTTRDPRKGSSLFTTAGNISAWMPIPAKITEGLRRVGAAGNGEDEATRMAAAAQLITKRRAWEKLREKTGPSPYGETSEAFIKATNDAADGVPTTDPEELLRQTIQQYEQRLATPAPLPSKRAINEASALRERGEIPTIFEGQSPEPAYAGQIDETAELARRAAIKERNKMFTQQDNALGGFDKQLDAPIPAPKAPKEPTAKERKALRDLIPSLDDTTKRFDPNAIDGVNELDPRDLRFPERSEKQIATSIRSREAALAKLEGGLEDFDTKLADPTTAPKPKATKSDPAEAAIDDAVSQGIQGDSGTHNAFANRLGTSVDDMLRTLDVVEKQVPDLADEIARIRLNYPTRNKRLGAVLGPRMKAAMDELGIQPKEADAPASIPVDDAAQARLGTQDGTKIANPTPRQQELLAELDKVDEIRVTFADGDSVRASQAGIQSPENAARSAEIRKELSETMAPPDQRRINRPAAWQASATRYQTQANDSITRMQEDPRISRDALDTIGNAPVQLRDNFKNIADAEAYIVNRILPDLEADGMSAGEINAVKRHLYEIAQAKPHANQAAYDKEMAARPPGRQTKPKE